eukprot:53360-Prymnesium_polylepis.2
MDTDRTSDKFFAFRKGQRVGLPTPERRGAMGGKRFSRWSAAARGAVGGDRSSPCPAEQVALHRSLAFPHQRYLRPRLSHAPDAPYIMYMCARPHMPAQVLLNAISTRSQRDLNAISTRSQCDLNAPRIRWLARAAPLPHTSKCFFNLTPFVSHVSTSSLFCFDMISTLGT